MIAESKGGSTEENKFKNKTNYIPTTESGAPLKVGPKWAALVISANTGYTE